MTTVNRIPVPWIAVGLLSGTALAYEVLLTRLFSLVHWHHLVSMIISLALLGYGASGTFLALMRKHLNAHFRSLFLGNALLFALSSVLGFELARRLPLDPLALAWDGRQVLYLAGVYGLAAVPFFGVANCIGLALWRYRERSHLVYAVDLAGAGLGAIIVVGLLFVLHPGSALGMLAVSGATAVLIGAWELRSTMRTAAILALLLLSAGIITWHYVEWDIPGADYKALSRSLAINGANVDHQFSTPLGVITVVNNEQVPLRHAPGLSLGAGPPPPPQRALFIDGDPLGAITRFEGEHFPAYLAALPSALPYRLLDNPRVLILEHKGGDSVLQALSLGAQKVTATSLHPPLQSLLQKDPEASSHGLFNRPDVEPFVTDPRAFLATTHRQFDLIQIDFAGGGGIGGLQAQDEAYEYTLEAFHAYLGRLLPHGKLAITRWAQAPPRDSLRLVATARLALEQAGIAHPEKHLALIRSWRTFTLLVSRSPLQPADIAKIRAFCRQLGFDPAWFPGIQRVETNRYHRLEQPWYYEGVKAILGPESQKFIADYPFLIEPVSDNRPYFHRFSRVSAVPQLLTLPAGTGFGQFDWGYGFLAATFVQALLAACLLIMLPLLFLKRADAQAGMRWKTLLYFAILGVAFLFIEIAFIQHFRLFLGNPLHAISVVLAGFLMFAGVGSWLSSACKTAFRTTLRWSVVSIGLFSLGYLWLLPALFEHLVTWSQPLTGITCLLLIAPLAIPMGMPFPLGLAELNLHAPQLMPWAWGLNGSFSVVSAVAASLLAMEVGFSGLIVIAVLLYALLPSLYRRQ